MKLLLVAINAKYIHSNPAVYSLKAYAEKHAKAAQTGEMTIEIAEYTINNRMEEIMADLYRRGADWIGFSCYIWNREMIDSLLPEVAKVCPGVPLWLGGPESSYDAFRTLDRLPMVTGVMVGEGEETFARLVDFYAGAEGKMTEAKGLKEIAGLCIRNEDNKPVFTALRECMDLDDVEFYYGDLKEFDNKIIYYESSRGCPFSCSYCLSSVDKNMRFRSWEKVSRELMFFLDHRVPQVKFVDRTFNCRREHADRIWQFLLDNDNGVTNFHFEISADLLTEEEMAIFEQMRPGLIQLEIGVQSVNPDTIREIRRSMNLERLKANVAHVHSMGNIHQHLDLIAGLPFEDFSSFAHSFDEVYAMEPDQLQLGFLKVLKGSHMAERTEEYGIVCRDCPPYEVLYTKWLSFDDVLRLKRIEEMVEEFYNSAQFIHTLKVLVRRFEGPFAMYDALARFYEEEGYFTAQPARGYRYDVLLAFARKWDGANEMFYRELLTYDYYLRENAKRRPAFAGDLYEFKEEIYRRERDKYDRIEIFSYPVWEPDVDSRAPREGKNLYFVRFDYEKKDPLSGNARTELV